jgi:uncharacterized protein (TIGR03118 family)
MKRFHVCLAICMTAYPLFDAGAVAISITNLVTDDQSAHAAQLPDSTLKNAWGISHIDGSQFWVSSNGGGVSNVYAVTGASNTVIQSPLQVTIPGAGNVTGQVSNAGNGFNGDRFLFVSEDGTISGWRSALGDHAETLRTGTPTAVYKGVTLASVNDHDYLYAANFGAGTIDVVPGQSGTPALVGNFTDPTLPAGYAPFNIQRIGDKLYVTYALKETGGDDDVPGAGHGFVSVFDLQGNFVQRLVSGDPLNSPWGMVVAPASFGALAGNLLVGNFGDGRISAFDLGTGAPKGQLQGTVGMPAVIDGLWGLIAGDDGLGGSSQKLYFAAGPDGEQHGLFGVLTPVAAVPEPASLALVGWCLAVVLVLRTIRRWAM